MINIAQWLVESSFCLVVFYGFYQLVLKHETFFQLNRIYLLFTPLLAFIIPMLNIQLQKNTLREIHPVATYTLPIIEESLAFEQQIWKSPTEQTITVADVAFWIYLTGTLGMFIVLMIGLIKLFKVIKKGKKSTTPNYKVVEDTPFPASSFFSYVFWNGKRMSDQQKWIWEHEMVHVRQWHSLDVLLMELWVIIKWFNPLIYFYRKSLRITHEYIADQYVSNQIGSTYQYALCLTQNSTLASNQPYVHHFAHFLKKRLLMLSRQPSQHWKKAKYGLCVPLFSAMMLLFSFDLVHNLPMPVQKTFEKAEALLVDMGAQPAVPSSLNQALVNLQSTPEISLEPIANKLVTRLALKQPTIPFLPQASSEKSDYLDILAQLLYKVNNQPHTIRQDTSKFKMTWMGQECDCTPGQLPNYYHCTNQSFRPREFKKVTKSGGFKLYKDGIEVPYDELQVSSRRAFKMQGTLNQFDFQNIFNPKSKFWKELKKGDVLKFTFKSGVSDYFHFNITINDAKERFDYDYAFQMGDLTIPIEMTNNIGIKYIDYEDYLKIRDGEIQLTKNNGELMKLKNLSVSISPMIGSDIGSQYFDDFTSVKPAQLPALKYAQPGTELRYRIGLEDDKSLKVNLFIRGKLDKEQLPEIAMVWGKNKSYSVKPYFVVSKEDAAQLASTPFHISLDGKKVDIQSIDRVLLMSGNPNGACQLADYQADQSCLQEMLNAAQQNDVILLRGLKTKEGQFFNASIKIGTPQEIYDYEYFNNHFKVSELQHHSFAVKNPIENIGPEGIEKFFDYRSMDGEMPEVQINKVSYTGQAAVSALEELDYDHIALLHFYPKGYQKRGLLYEGSAPYQNAVLDIQVEEESVIRSLSFPEGMELEDANAGIRELEDIGEAVYLVIDGEVLGVTPGNELKRILKQLDPEKVESIDILKGEDAVARFGDAAKIGSIVIKTIGLDLESLESPSPQNSVDRIDDIDPENVKLEEIPTVVSIHKNFYEALENVKLEEITTPGKSDKVLLIVDEKIHGVLSKDERNKIVNALDHHNIESMTVLRGESATEQYGPKAQNGAIIIKMKNQ